MLMMMGYGYLYWYIRNECFYVVYILFNINSNGDGEDMLVFMLL